MTNLLLYSEKKKGCEDKSEVMVYSPWNHEKMCLQRQREDTQKCLSVDCLGWWNHGKFFHSTFKTLWDAIVFSLMRNTHPKSKAKYPISSRSLAINKNCLWFYKRTGEQNAGTKKLCGNNLFHNGFQDYYIKKASGLHSDFDIHQKIFSWALFPSIELQ